MKLIPLLIFLSVDKIIDELRDSQQQTLPAKKDTTGNSETSQTPFHIDQPSVDDENTNIDELFGGEKELDELSEEERVANQPGDVHHNSKSDISDESDSPCPKSKRKPPATKATSQWKRQRSKGPSILISNLDSG
jgi:hypothetical protein